MFGLLVIRLVPADEGGETVFDRGLGLEIDVAGQVGDVSIGARHITGLHRQVFFVGDLADRLFQDLNKIAELLRVVVADVVDLVRCRAARQIAVSLGPGRIGLGDFRRQAGDRSHDIIDIGEVALHLAMVEDLDRLAGQDVAGEGKIRHVRTAPGSIDGEKPQAGGRDAVEVAVGVGHQLVGFFCRGIEADGMVDVVVGRKRHDGIAAVDRAGGGIEQMADRKVAAGLEDVEETGQVRVEVSVRVFD